MTNHLAAGWRAIALGPKVGVLRTPLFRSFLIAHLQPFFHLLSRGDHHSDLPLNHVAWERQIWLQKASLMNHGDSATEAGAYSGAYDRSLSGLFRDPNLGSTFGMEGANDVEPIKRLLPFLMKCPKIEEQIGRAHV